MSACWPLFCAHERVLTAFCAVSSEMKLQPNIGSDRSWVWKVLADYAEIPPTSETLAIRFANSDSAWLLTCYHSSA